ncbi:unnamed protein product [Owenia fusiformis]|uniref:Centrosomal protein of 78 kDa n=1 Tax=Owenia fusiformis TaxID=6347 RepID=A0A8S4P7D2_OWEFU|nr:unnamed protein product [Owenia fusiformis]
MIESVQVRQRGAYDFESHYDNLCALQDSVPIPAVKAHLSQGLLDVNGDRIRSNDWVPVLNTLRINKSLNFIGVRSYFQLPLDEQGQIPEDKSLIWKKKTPAVRSKEITYRLCKSLKECLTVTPVLSTLELQGLPLRDKDLMCLAKGVSKNSTLTHLSLEYCRIGDAGLEIVCKGIKNSTTIAAINFTGCSLTWKGAEILSKIVKHQGMKRHNEAWRDSLRYRRPDLDRMAGIRRITVNCNPMLNDQGALSFAEALKDDLWLKALDMQQCGVSSQGAKALLDVLKFNTTLVVLDVRQNPLIDRSILTRIMEQVMINSDGQDTEWRWIKVESPEDPNKVKVRKKKTKTLNSSFGRKATIKVNTPGSGKKKSKSYVAARHTLHPITPCPSPGIPWRTALRASRYKGYPPNHTPGQASILERSEDTTQLEHSIHVDESTGSDEETNNNIDDAILEQSDEDLDFKRHMKSFKVEFEQLKRRLEQETQARAKADQRIIELTVENSRLKQELNDVKMSMSLLNNESILDNIEASFQQFHAFLDTLREAGLGELITLGGLDQDQMPFSRPPQPPSSSMPHSQMNIPHPQATVPHPQASRPPPGVHRVQSGPPYYTTAGPPSSTPEYIQRFQSHLNNRAEPNISHLDYTLKEGQDPHTGQPDPHRGQGDKYVAPNLTPQTYKAAPDPTMHPVPQRQPHPVPPTDPTPTNHPDDLYQRVLKETQAALHPVSGTHSVHGAFPMSGAITPPTGDDIDDLGVVQPAAIQLDQIPPSTESKPQSERPQPTPRSTVSSKPAVTAQESQDRSDSEHYSKNDAKNIGNKHSEKEQSDGDQLSEQLSGLSGLEQYIPPETPDNYEDSFNISDHDSSSSHHLPASPVDRPTPEQQVINDSVKGSEHSSVIEEIGEQYSESFEHSVLSDKEQSTILTESEDQDF